MQIASILLALGGEKDNTVPKFNVTPAEVAVLRVIHGDDSVTDIQPTGTVERRNRDERQRLVEVYGRRIDGSRRAAPAVEALFPGAAARVFETFDELDLPETFFKASGHVTSASPAAKAVAPAADEPEQNPRGELKTLTVVQLREYATINRIELGESTKKADIIAAIEAHEAAQAADHANEVVNDDDGIEEINDGASGGDNLFK